MQMREHEPYKWLFTQRGAFGYLYALQYQWNGISRVDIAKLPRLASCLDE